MPPMDELTKIYYANNPQAAFDFLYPGATSGRGNKSKWLSGQHDRLFRQYATQGPSGPNASYFDFLGGQDLENEWNRATPGMRGENPSAYSPSVRYNFRRF